MSESKHNLPRDYTTLSEAMNGVRELGYDCEFELKSDHIICDEKDVRYQPNEFEVIQVYRFEGMSNPSDMSVLYVVEGKDGTKGVIADAYGTYAEEVTQELAKKLHRDNYYN